MAWSIPHILVVPFPAQGHVLPLLDLLHRLCLRFTLSITIIISPSYAPLFSPLLNSHPSHINTLSLPLPSHPSLPPGLQNIRDMGPSGALAMIAALKQLCPLISNWFHSLTDPPVAILYDFLLGWTVSLAHELSIPCFVHYTTGAFAVCIIEYCWRHEYIREMESIELKDIPGSPCFKLHELQSSFRRYVKNDPDLEMLRNGYLSNLNAYGCIIYTFEGMEGKYISHVVQEKGHCRVYSVGPPSVQEMVDLDSDSKMWWVFDWLDGWASESVIYVCFGSQKCMNEEQMSGIAGGLEESGRRFVWVVNSSARNGRVPEGFEERMREEGRGIVVREWAPQRMILGHRAVGGFLTHCGWNSTMEGIQCGVRFLTWPMQAEQYLNAWLLENDLRIGSRICEGSECIPDAKSFGEAIRLWDAETENVNEARERAAALRQKAGDAILEAGTTSINIEKLAHHFTQLAAQPSSLDNNLQNT